MSELSINPNAIKILEENTNKINWIYFSRNYNGLKILLKNTHNICWYQLSRNENPDVIKVLAENKDKIDWRFLSANPIAMKLLSENPHKICWFHFSKNPAIFQLDYEAMRIANQGMEEELLKEVLKPSRVFKYYDDSHNSYDSHYDYLEELFGD